MRFKYETFDQKITRLGKWTKWFAWYPIFHNGTFYWLEYIERRAEWRAGYEYCFWLWYYRRIRRFK